MPQARPKIEREKIRHRRPNDLHFDDGQGPAPRAPLLTEEPDGGVYDDNVYTDQDWTAEESRPAEMSAWDDESEDDWVLDETGEDYTADYGDGAYVEDDGDESGVIWEEDAYNDHEVAGRSGEITFGDHRESLGDAPEVELAGRRDVRPKPPRPAPPDRPPAPRQARPAPANRRPRQEARMARPEPAWEEEDDTEVAPPPQEVGFTPRVAPRPVRAAPPPEPHDPAFEGERFSRTRATLGAPAAALGSAGSKEVLDQPRAGPAPRRRQSKPAQAPAPPLGRRRATPYRNRSYKGLILAVVAIVLIAGGAWFAYQSIGQGGLQTAVDRLSALLPFPSSSRTAADTSFESQTPGDASAAAEALSDLEERVRQQNGAAAGSGANGAVDPATNRVDGPPIPKFKPLPNAQRSTATPAPTIEATQLAANDANPNAEPEPTLFEQLWRYINPG